ncbi:MAG: GH3 auxin-responsive promoter family protein [Bacteroidales bacterium]|nr:GH3 auxin-responsive promoter family protein [Bacteroidales bacterium]
MPIVGSIIKRGIALRSKFPNDIIRFRLRAKNPIKTQEKELRKLVNKATATSFGDRFEFEKILDGKNLIKDFQTQVPIYDYNSIYQDWWYRCLNGETYVCWPGKVKYFALSSGTSEASSKYIPVTSDMISAIKRTSVRQLLSLANYEFPAEFYQKPVLMLGGSTHLQYNGTYFAGDLSGITTGNIPFWFQHFYKPGNHISRERDWPTKLEEIIKNAPKWDIGVIVGVPAWFQILLEKIIERYNLNTIHDIWPTLSIFVHGGVAFTPYKNSFEKLLGKPLTYMETYLASEGFIAYQNRPNVSTMELVIDNGIFYEFVPFEESNFDDEYNILSTAKTLTIDQVEEGVEYALLISTCAGAWRYLIGDTIKFTSKELLEICITGRTKQFLNLCGEHMSVENMNSAIKMLEDEMGVAIREFTVIGYKRSEGSMFAHKWFLGTDSELDNKVAAEKIDEYLKVLNDDYRVERMEAIREISAEVVPLSAFYDWLRKNSKEGSQNKFPRVLKGNKCTDWLEFIKSYQKHE